MAVNSLGFLGPPPSLDSLPPEFYEKIAEYLTPLNCKNISQCNSSLQSIFRPISWTYVEIVAAESDTNSDYLSTRRKLPVKVFVNTEIFSWFSCHYVRNAIMDKMEPHLLSFFAVRQFPYLQRIRFRFFPTDSLVETIVSQKYICMISLFYPGGVLQVDMNMSPSDYCNSLFFQPSFARTITSLSLSDIFLSTEKFPRLAEFGSLEKIDMFEISDDVFDYIISQVPNCPKLRKFFSHHWMHKDTHPLLIQRSFVQLVNLPNTLEQCSIILQYPFFPEDDSDLLDMDTFHERAHLINLPQIKTIAFRFGVTAFKSLCSHFSFPQLKQLSITSQKSDPTSETLTPISNSLTKLSINIHRDNLLSLLSILDSLPLLKSISIEIESPSLRYFPEIQPYLVAVAQKYIDTDPVPEIKLHSLFRKNHQLYDVLSHGPEIASNAVEIGPKLLKQTPLEATQALISLVNSNQSSYQQFLEAQWVGSSEFSTMSFFELLFRALGQVDSLQYLSVDVGVNFFQPCLALCRLLRSSKNLKQVLLNFQNYEHDKVLLRDESEVRDPGVDDYYDSFLQVDEADDENGVELATFSCKNYGVIPKVPYMVMLDNDHLVLYDTGMKRTFLQSFDSLLVSPEDFLRHDFSGWL